MNSSHITEETLTQGIYRAITEHGAGIFNIAGKSFENHGEGWFLIPAADKAHTFSVFTHDEASARAASENFATNFIEEAKLLEQSGARIAIIIAHSGNDNLPDDDVIEISLANITPNREDAAVIAKERKLSRYFDITNDTWISTKTESHA
jgi:hypothetical protein